MNDNKDKLAKLEAELKELEEKCKETVGNANTQTLLMLVLHEPVNKKIEEIRKELKNVNNFSQKQKILQLGVDWIWKRSVGLHYDDRFKSGIENYIEAQIIIAPTCNFEIINDERNGSNFIHPFVKYYKPLTNVEQKYLQKQLAYIFLRKGSKNQSQNYKATESMNESLILKAFRRYNGKFIKKASKTEIQTGNMRKYKPENAFLHTLEFLGKDMGVNSGLNEKSEKERYKKRLQLLDKEVKRRINWQEEI